MAELYRYTDSAGAVHLVQDLREVPPALRAKAKLAQGDVTIETRAEAEVRAPTPTLPTPAAVQGALKSVGWVGEVHLPSVLLGATAVLVVALIVSLVRGRSTRLLKLGITMGLIAAAGVGYMTWLRSVASGGGSGVATPAAIVHTAREAAQSVDTHHQQKLEALEAMQER